MTRSPVSVLMKCCLKYIRLLLHYRLQGPVWDLVASSGQVAVCNQPNARQPAFGYSPNNTWRPKAVLSQRKCPGYMCRWHLTIQFQPVYLPVQSGAELSCQSLDSGTRLKLIPIRISPRVQTFVPRCEFNVHKSFHENPIHIHTHTSNTCQNTTKMATYIYFCRDTYGKCQFNA